MTADSARYRRALTSLRGLAVGDALGAQFFVPGNPETLRRRELPPGPWAWTDDTEMACSVLAVLAVLVHDRSVDQDALARSFAEHHDPARGYGRAVSRMLERFRAGAHWSDEAAGLFDGAGSWGNGAAMRVAPLGAWYADDPARAAAGAERSAYVTHQHREAVAGAIAVGVAAALVAGGENRPGPLLDAVLERVPRSAVQAGTRRARDLLDYADIGTVAAVLGCGRRTSAHDTVPFALWAAARHLGDYQRALWSCLQAGGDTDTTGAIVGGILAAAPAGAPPAAWLRRTEPLPGWLPGEA
jgi:ADP-ribosylglycohydrolase